MRDLDIWSLSDSTYPYLGYVVVDMEFPKKWVGTPTTMSVLAVIRPAAPDPDQTPVIIGTNAKTNLPIRLAQLCEETSGVDVVHTLGVHSSCSELKKMSVAELAGGDGGGNKVGCVKWEGPGPLMLPAGGSCQAVCKVVLEQPLPEEILMVEASSAHPLPAGLLLQSMIIPSSTVDVNELTVLIENESLKEVTIAVGTVLSCLCAIDVVMTGSSTVQPLASEKFDASLMNFGQSPSLEEWKAKLLS